MIITSKTKHYELQQFFMIALTPNRQTINKQFSTEYMNKHISIYYVWAFRFRS